MAGCRGWVYCFKRGEKAVFLNRWDQEIKEFETYKEAVEFADKNIYLIDISKDVSDMDVGDINFNPQRKQQ